MRQPLRSKTNRLGAAEPACQALPAPALAAAGGGAKASIGDSVITGSGRIAGGGTFTPTNGCDGGGARGRKTAAGGATATRSADGAVPMLFAARNGITTSVPESAKPPRWSLVREVTMPRISPVPGSNTAP